MKLSERTNVYFIAITIAIFAIGGLVFYFEIGTDTRKDADERLQYEKERVINYLDAHKALPPQSLSLGDSIAFHPMASKHGYVPSYMPEEKGTDTIIYSVNEKETEPYRMLKFEANIDTNHYYRVTIFKPLIENDDLTNAIVNTIGIIAVTLFIILVFANHFITKRIWKPFYRILSKAEEFDLTNNARVEFDNTSIQEFKELKNVLEIMTGKIASDYHSLKEFTENASHELQTPLAIIQSKLELLIQSENLSAKQMEEVQAVYESAGRLSKLNQALLLLAKIENRQFADAKPVLLNELIEYKLEAFEELLKHKGISVEKHLTQVSLHMHPALADILINNLVGNAIKHNINSGKLIVDLSERQLSIKNTGKPLTISPEQLFERFRKADSNSESLGLGLAIVKEICDVYGFKVNYMYADNMHTINVSF
jgi:signal transduction histidine kinase